MLFSWRISGLATGIVLAFLFVSAAMAGPLTDGTPNSPDAEKRQTDSFGCIVGAAGMGIVTMAAVAVTAAPVDIAAAAAVGGGGAGAVMLPLMTASLAAGCAVGSAAAPAAVWILDQGGHATGRLAA